jgi:starch phosphorylase
MTQLTPTFSSDRMVREYVEQAYLPAATAYKRRAADQARLATELESWHSRLIEDWHGIRFGEIHVQEVSEGWHFEVQVYLGDLCRDCIRVELYSESADRQPSTPIVLEHDGAIPGAVNAFKFLGLAPADRPPEHYTPRIRPHHPDAFVPLESTHVHWRG